MKTIFKYPIQSLDGAVLAMPQGARILALQKQGGIPTIWALVEPDEPPENRRFVVYGTGHRIQNPDKEEYVGTWQDEPFVWHLFEVRA